LDQQRPEAAITGLADSELLVDVTGLATPWRETKVRSNIARVRESVRIADGQHILKGRDRPNPADLAETTSLWILFPCHTIDGFIELVDLFVQVRDGFQERQ
jgi:hypothetical protein